MRDDFPSLRLSHDMSDTAFWATVADIRRARDCAADEAARLRRRDWLLVALAALFLFGQIARLIL